MTQSIREFEAVRLQRRADLLSNDAFHRPSASGGLTTDPRAGDPNIDLLGEWTRDLIVQGSVGTSWLPAAAAKLETILQLPENWDSYGAHRVSPESVRHALWLLGEVWPGDAQAPEFVPRNSGGVEVWWGNGRQVYSVAVEGDVLTEFFEDEETGESFEREVKRPLSEVRQALISLFY